MKTIKLILTDTHGTPLNFGDIVRVNSGRGGDSCFYSEVKYLEKEKAIAPFHTFSFHSFEKVDKVPENAKELSETRYKAWYIDKDAESEKNFEGYLMDWRKCEHELNRCFHIILEEEKGIQQKMFAD
jgi:hypothetical protein